MKRVLKGRIKGSLPVGVMRLTGRDPFFCRGESNVHRADAVVINKVDTAEPKKVETLKATVKEANPRVLVTYELEERGTPDSRAIVRKFIRTRTRGKQAAKNRTDI